MTKEEQKVIDTINMLGHYAMCSLWRFAPAYHPYFDSTRPYYQIFKKRFDAFGGFTPAISKSLGHNK